MGKGKERIIFDRGDRPVVLYVLSLPKCPSFFLKSDAWVEYGHKDVPKEKAEDSKD